MSAVPTDRAAVVATAVLQIIRETLLAWLRGDDVNLGAARAQIEVILRDEFHDVARATTNEIRREDD